MQGSEFVMPEPVEDDANEHNAIFGIFLQKLTIENLQHLVMRNRRAPALQAPIHTIGTKHGVDNRFFGGFHLRYSCPKIIHLQQVNSEFPNLANLVNGTF
jgi:hypothetical protein